MTDTLLDVYYKRSKLILAMIHQYNVDRFNAGKVNEVSDSAIRFRKVLDKTFSEKDLRGMKLMYKDFLQVSKCLSKEKREELKRFMKETEIHT